MAGVLFVLPVGGGSGGAHSVMQEANAMWRLGVPVAIACNTDNAEKLRRGYRDLDPIHRYIRPYANPEALAQMILEMGPEVVIATTNQSVHVLQRAIGAQEALKGLHTAYYVQDYEPLFYEKDSDDWVTAYSSYGLIPGMVHFAKTQWLQEVVEHNHGVSVHKVQASIDHTVYYPQVPFRLQPKLELVVAAMLRPATPRRAPRRTMRILNRLQHRSGAAIKCVSFGCSAEELDDFGLRPQGFTHLGVLDRDEVGDLFRGTDLFLDLSDYQAFGRTALEAMSCGAVSVVPLHGGSSEFAEDGRNSFVVDTRDDEAILRAVTFYTGMPEGDRITMNLAALETGYRYSPEQAALSELSMLLRPL